MPIGWSPGSAIEAWGVRRVGRRIEQLGVHVKRRIHLLATAALWTTAAATLLPLAAIAATDQTTAVATTTSDATTVEDVVVTAERFKSTVQTTPVAVTAMSPRMLQERQIDSVEQLGTQVPGLVLTPATGSSSTLRIVLRGADEEQGGINFDPAVGLYIDNVYQPRLNGAFFDFFDISNLEVLRGPQGTLYGKNTAGGAIKIQTADPSYSWTWGGDVAYGNYNSVSARGFVSGPIIPDVLAFSLSGVTRQRDGLITDPYYSKPVDNLDRQAVRGKLLFTPTPKLRVVLAAFYQQDSSDPAIGVPLQVAPTVIDPAIVPNRNLFTSELFGPEKAHLQNTGLSLNASYEVSPILTVNSITAYQNLRSFAEEPFWLTKSPPPATPTSASTGGASLIKDYFYSEELNATVDTKKFKGVVGLYYFHENGDAYALLPYSTPNDQYRRTTDYAAYGQGTYNIIGGLGLTLGIRYTEEKANFTQFYFVPTAAFPNPYPQSAAKTFQSVTPKVGLDWQATPNFLAYISFTEGYIAGGFNPISPNTNTGVVGVPGAPTPYGAETVNSYEAGVKYTNVDHRFRINGAIFDAEYKGLQLPVFFPGTSNSFTSNASNARIQGIELEPTWQPVESLQLYSNMSFLTSKYLAPFPCSLANGSIANCEGKKIKGVIPAKVVVGFVYSPDLNFPGKWRLLADYEYSSAYYNNVANQGPLVQTPVIELINASVNWTSADGRWTVAFEGKNLANNHYVLDGLQLASPIVPTVTGYPGDPRMFDVRVGVKF